MFCTYMHIHPHPPVPCHRADPRDLVCRPCLEHHLLHVRHVAQVHFFLASLRFLLPRAHLADLGCRRGLAPRLAPFSQLDQAGLLVPGGPSDQRLLVVLFYPERLPLLLDQSRPSVQQSPAGREDLEVPPGLLDLEDQRDLVDPGGPPHLSILSCLPVAAQLRFVDCCPGLLQLASH